MGLSRILIKFTMITLLAAACSHKTPFIRPGLTDSVPVPSLVEIKQRLLLVGDAGKPQTPGETNRTEIVDPVLKALAQKAAELPSNTTIVFLGDNIYEEGMVKEDERSRGFLNAQLYVLQKSGARGIFVPGNHDWKSGKKGGREALARQEAYIDRDWPAYADFLPESGCPGPTKIDLDGVRIVIIDTQWWLHNIDDKPLLECFPGFDVVDKIDRDSLFKVASSLFADSLRVLANGSGDNEVVVVAHHPISSNGPHGGFLEWKDYLLPLPLIIPVGRKLLKIGSGQDLSGGQYKRLISLFQEVLGSGQRPLLYASGHDHSLQVMDGNLAADYLLVSGAGSIPKITPVTDDESTVFALSRPGFMSVDFLIDGGVILQVFAFLKDAQGIERVFSYRLKE